MTTTAHYLREANFTVSMMLTMLTEVRVPELMSLHQVLWNLLGKARIVGDVDAPLTSPSRIDRRVVLL